MQGFDLNSITSGSFLPILAIGAIAYFALTSKGGEMSSLIRKKSVQTELAKVSAEASAKAAEQAALE